MVKLWIILALEPIIAKSLSLVKATGQMVANYGVQPDRQVKLVILIQLKSL